MKFCSLLLIFISFAAARDNLVSLKVELGFVFCFFINLF